MTWPGWCWIEGIVLFLLAGVEWQASDIAIAGAQGVRVYLYLRTSELECRDDNPVSRSEKDQGTEAEIRALYAYSHQRGWAVSEIFHDCAVDWRLDLAARTEGGRLLESLRSGDLVLIHSLERMFSSCYDASLVLELMRRNEHALHVASLDAEVTDPEWVMDIVSASRLFAELERRRSTERIRKIKSKQRSKGRYLGGSRPFGYMIHSNGRLIENPLEQKVLKRIMQLRDQGKSLRAIATEVSTPIAPVSFKTVQRILQRNV
jgi:DNA invertase Pin-like site-specific DNA recombinase